jgi:hypothetical protein
MDKKKGLKAFLNKNKKTNAAATTADASPDKEETKKVDVPDISKIDLTSKAEEPKQQKQKIKSADESSSEDDDDMRIGTYGKVLEKEESTAAQEEEETKAPTEFADLDKDTTPADKKAQKKAAAKTAGQISFGGGRPTFGNRGVARTTLTKDDGGLEDLDDEGPSKSKKAQKAEKAMAGVITRNPVQVAEEPKGPVRPTFKGKLKLNAGQDTEASGMVAHSYDFKSRAGDEEEKGHKKGKPQHYNINGG